MNYDPAGLALASKDTRLRFHQFALQYRNAHVPERALGFIT
jgi:hypothetical protein